MEVESQILSNWSNQKPLVSIICCTFNQEKYLKQTLDGFLLQKTSFAFEVLVNDDASTDDTVNILKGYKKKYPHIIKPIFHKINEYSQGIDVFESVVKLSKGKYIAICEGDDYWVDSNKLQFQVDFLESNANYGLCYTHARRYYQSENTFGKKYFGSKIGSFETLLRANDIPTMTVVLRKELYNQFLAEINPLDKKWMMGDYPLWLYCAHESKIKFFNKCTSVYRILDESASHSKSLKYNLKFTQSVYDIREYFSNKYNLNIDFTDYKNIDFAIWAFRFNEDEKARQYLKEIKHYNTLKNWVKCFVLKNGFLRKLYLK